MKRLLAWFDASASEDTKRYGGHIHLESEHGPNSILSLTDHPDRHMPILDDDLGLFRIVPSGTNGHQHVYIDKDLDWEDWKELLGLLGKLGLVDPKWAKASIAQGTATLRLPDHPKLTEP